MFRGPAVDDQSDGSSWARSVESRFQKILARVTTADIVDRSVTSAKLAVDSVASEHLVAAIPRGVLGVASTTTTQSGISASTDLTGLSVVATVLAGRRIRVSWFDPNPNGTAANDDFTFQLKQDAAIIQDAVYGIPAANDHNRPANVWVTLVPGAGTFTYKVTVTRTGGTGTIAFTRGATAPGQLLVEDIGS